MMLCPADTPCLGTMQQHLEVDAGVMAAPASCG